MTNLPEISVRGTVETVVKKLSRANIAAFNVKKRGNVITFQVHKESLEKVFAIFKHPCYNINIRRSGKKSKLINFLLNRAGLVVGGALFILLAILSNSFVLKIQVTGSGSYLQSQILTILSDSGIATGKFLPAIEKPVVSSRIMALPQVTFCNITKSGGVVIVDVYVEEENNSTPTYSALCSDTDGVLKNLVVVCGTAEAVIGEKVSVGQTLIGAYKTLSNGEQKDCLAVGFAEIERTLTICVNADGDTESNLALALNAPLLYTDSVIQKDYKVKENSDGVVYEVTFSYLYTLSINMQ